MPSAISLVILSLLGLCAVVLSGRWAGLWMPALAGATLATAGVVLGTKLFGIYGLVLFVALPVGVGWIAGLVILKSRPTASFRNLAGVVALIFGITGLLLLFLGLEGLLCLLMAAPLAFPLALLGAWGSRKLAARLQPPAGATALLMVLLMPCGLGTERLLAPASACLSVRTVVEVAAPPDVVWRHVVSFPPLPPPREWFFRAGVAYPQRAEIQGRGVGAVRRCVFSTGAFVEPIVLWDEPRRLRFTVRDNPPSLDELSPYEIRPAHVQGYLISRQGEFLLTPLPGGRTLLAGTTWYQDALRPAPYWRLWTDWILHRIHRRVLDQIKRRAEEDYGRGSRLAQAGSPLR